MVSRPPVWLIALASLLLTACRPASTDDIVFAVATPPSMLDPRIASDAVSERVNALLFDRLVALDPQGRPVPRMAAWRQLGPRRYRLHLRDDRATFWDGRLPSSADVAATYNSLLDPALGSPHASALAHIQTIEIHDSDTLDFVLKRPDPRFPSRLTVGILPADLGDDRRAVGEPVGSGPFRLLERRDDKGLVLQRRRDGQRLVFEAVPDPTMRTLKLLRGEARLVQNDLPAELFSVLERASGLRVASNPGTTFAYIGFNLRDPVLADRRVRAAIAHAIDRDAIIHHLLGGRAEKAESILRPEHWAGVADLRPYRHDPDSARRYLREAGYGPQRRLTLSYKTSTDPLRLRIAHVLQSQLADVGIELRIASYDWGTFFGDIKAGRFQLYSLAWVGVNTPDILRYAFHSTASPPAGANRGGYRSTRVDALLAHAEQRANDAARADYIAVQREIHRDLVYVPLWYEANVAVSRAIRGYAPGHDGDYLALNAVVLEHER